ncbi:YesN/AraC family two-component response regulator [Paenibacillus sp. DS2015]|uniref:helix-turn-helix transcriptional regulator n=1 Tax=Paenibacillus sp. DS2015 TaxID=3373917 RepID=UPI003D24699E
MTTVSKDELFQQLYSVMSMYHTHMGEGQAAHINKARAFIEVNLEHDVSLQRVARHVHVHPNHLSDVFKKETGATFGDFVTRIKIQRAMEIISESPAKVSDVAAQIGYGDVKYFSKIFNKHTGKTPSEFRENTTC